MRPLFLSLGGILAVSIAAAQVAGDATNVPQLPVGQTFEKFEFPVYQDGKLRYTLNAVQAKGITLNRAETTELRIEVYDNGKKTTIITSPKADLYVAEQKMRTKNTVLIDRDDMRATSQDCDFDVKSKKYLLRNNVKVVLKHFDLASGPNGKKPANATSTPAPTTAAVSAATPNSTPAPVTESAEPSPTPAPVPEQAPTPTAPPRTDTLPTSPSVYADTNSAPIAPSSSTK